MPEQKALGIIRPKSILPKVAAFPQVSIKVASLGGHTDLLAVSSGRDTVPALYEVSLLDLALALLAAAAHLSRA